MTREYFNENVNMAIELEDEYGHREWYTMKGSETEAFLDRMCKTDSDDENHYYWFSDEDFCTKQDDTSVRDFLNKVHYNFRHNPRFKGMGLGKVLDLAFEA